MFKLTLSTSCGIQSRARLWLYMYALRMRQLVNTPLWEELRGEKNSSYELILCTLGEQSAGCCSPFLQNLSGVAECSADSNIWMIQVRNRRERQRTKYICQWDLEGSEENEVTRYSLGCSRWEKTWSKWALPELRETEKAFYCLTGSSAEQLAFLLLT